MCGIFGWHTTSTEDYSVSIDRAKKIFVALAHRGPNDRGCVVFNRQGEAIGDESSLFACKQDAPAFVLGHTRLSIIDLSMAGHQPMVSPDGRFYLTFNGEIYNYIELRKEIQAEGYQFRTNTDSEVLLAALSIWGCNRECLLRLDGMFAFALYDVQRRQIFCARDFFGIKPLYYVNTEKGWAFASELPALFHIPVIMRKVDPLVLYNYLLYGRINSGDECIIKNVRQLPAAHFLKIDLAENKISESKRYWKVELPEPDIVPFSGAVEKVRHLFLQSVRRQLRSDVPLGFALSGGLDSSAITCAAHYIEPELPLSTFSFFADDPSLDEERWVDEIVRVTGSTRHFVRVKASDLVRDLDDLILSQGEPFASTSLYAQYRVFKLAFDVGVVVMLDGQGADEMLAGYQGYPIERLQTLRAREGFSAELQFYLNCRKWPGRGSGQVLLNILSTRIPGFGRLFNALTRGSAPVDAINHQVFEELAAATFLPWREAEWKSIDEMRVTMANMLSSHGLPSLLRHGDRNSMRFSIESRVPFCTRELAEYLFSLPEDYLLSRDGFTKHVFREAMRGIVPDQIVYRKDKIGFVTPEKMWLSEINHWVRDTFSSSRSAFIDSNNALGEWDMVMSGRTNYTQKFWRQLNYLRWKSLLSIEE